MKPRQLNLFADKKHFRELNARLQKAIVSPQRNCAHFPKEENSEAKEIMKKQKPEPEQLLMITNESKISNSHERKEIGCGVWA